MPKNDAPAAPLHAVEPVKRGRPRKLPEKAPLPQLDMEPAEKALFDYFIQSHLTEHPDLTSTDQLLLFLAACEYIKYCRMTQQELTDGKLVSITRQHPGTQFLRLMESLSVTRKARQKVKQEPDEDDFTTNLWKA